MAGYPSITVPLGEVHGLPVGLLFIGHVYGEGDLLSLAYSYEQSSRQRTPPKYLDDIP
jgi:amidase